MKFKDGDIVYIREDIETICQQREEARLWVDTPDYFFRYAGKKVKIVLAESRKKYTDSYTDDELSEPYFGGAYMLEDMSGSSVGNWWYDFHLISINVEAIDVNIL